MGFPGGSDSKESACNAVNPNSVPRLGRSPGGEHGNPLQDSCLENPMDRRAYWVSVYRVTKSWTRLKGLSTHTESIYYNRKVFFKEYFSPGEILVLVLSDSLKT